MAVLMPEAKAPCKDCEERCLGCHATCEKYAAFKKDRGKFTRDLKKKVYEERLVQTYTIDSVYRVQGKRKHMK